MSQISVRLSQSAKLAVAMFVFVLPATGWAQVNWGNQRSVGGIMVDADGAVRQPTATERQEILAQLRAQPEQVPPELKLNTKFRKVSLRALEAALADAANSGGDLPDGVLYLAGLQRIQFILVYPEQNDIVLAGPGEGWKFDQDGNAVGVTTGLPAVRLDDLLVALRTVEAAKTQGISVSIDPTAEGRQRFEDVHEQPAEF